MAKPDTYSQFRANCTNSRLAICAVSYYPKDNFIKKYPWDNFIYKYMCLQ